MRERLLSLNEQKFIQTGLQQHQRIDGRRLTDVRKLQLKLGQQFGQVEVQLGQTRVYCVVSAQLTTPYPERPHDGSVIVNVEFSPMAHPSFETGKPNEAAVELSRIIDRSIRESRALDTESLCIISGQKAWGLRIDIHIIDHDGNLIDAASIACLAGLMHFRRPDVSIRGEQVIVHDIQERKPHPLNILHHPLSFSFGFFEEGNIMIMDPCYKEELVMDGRLIITINVQQQICAVQKAGGTPLSIQQISKCAQLASLKVPQIFGIIQEALKGVDSLANPLISNPRGIELQSVAVIPKTEQAFIAKLEKDEAQLRTSASTEKKAKTDTSDFMFKGEESAWKEEMNEEDEEEDDDDGDDDDDDDDEDEDEADEEGETNKKSIPTGIEQKQKEEFSQFATKFAQKSAPTPQHKPSLPTSQPKASPQPTKIHTPMKSEQKSNPGKLDETFSDEEEDTQVLFTPTKQEVQNSAEPVSVKKETTPAVLAENPSVSAAKKPVQGKTGKPLDLSSAIKKKK